MFAVATISSTLCTVESYLYLHDLCVFCVFWCMLLYVFLCVYGPRAWNKTDDDDDDDEWQHNKGDIGHSITLIIK